MEHHTGTSSQVTLKNEVSSLKQEIKEIRSQLQALQELGDNFKQVTEALQDQVKQSCKTSPAAAPSTLVSTNINHPPGCSLDGVSVVQATEAHKLQQQQKNFQRGEKEHNEMQIRITALEKQVDTLKQEVISLQKQVDQQEQEQWTQDEKHQQNDDNNGPEEAFNDEEKESTDEAAEIKNQPHIQGTKTYWVWECKGPNCTIIQIYISEKPVIQQGQILEYELPLNPVNTGQGLKLVVNTVFEGITHKLTSLIDEVDADAACGGVNIGSFLQVEVSHVEQTQYVELSCRFSCDKTTHVVKLALDLEQAWGKLWKEDIG